MKGMVLDAVRAVVRRGGIYAMALAVAAPLVRAQDSASAQPAAAAGATTGAAAGVAGTAAYRTHTVRAGETLYDIAQLYLGDGNLWPEVYRLNAATIGDPHWIYVNAVLRIPQGGAGDPASSIVATPASDAKPAAQTGTTDEPASGTAGTMFPHNPRGGITLASNRGSSGAGSAVPMRSAHDRQRAPYLDRDGGPRGAGTVLGTTGLSNVIDADDRAHFGLNADLYITMPAGSTAIVGDRYYTYSLGTSFGERGQIVTPTGIITVVQPGVGTDATVARITTLFGVVDKSQGVLPLDQSPMPSERPARVDDGVRTTVLWVEDGVVLPTLQYYVVLAASEKQGLHAGDQVTLYRGRLHVPESKVTLPESEIGIAQIIRVNGFAATAMIVASTEPDIEPGVAARVTARVP